jgi:hypothetical protein
MNLSVRGLRVPVTAPRTSRPWRRFSRATRAGTSPGSRFRYAATSGISPDREEW